MLVLMSMGGMLVGVRMLLFLIVVMVMMILLQVDVELHAFDIRFLSARRVQVVIVKLELLEFVFELFEIDAQVEHRPDEHIAADAAKNVEVDSFHFSSPAARALIWLAAKPAPNPLLMFTTVRPLLQLFSIASRAVNPPRCAP